MKSDGPVNHRIREVLLINRNEPHCSTCGRRVYWVRHRTKNGARSFEPYRVKAYWKHGRRPPYANSEEFRTLYLFPPTSTGC